MTAFFVEWAPADLPDRFGLPYRKEYRRSLRSSRCLDNTATRLGNLSFQRWPNHRKNLEAYRNVHRLSPSAPLALVEGHLQGVHDLGQRPTIPDEQHEHAEPPLGATEPRNSEPEPPIVLVALGARDGSGTGTSQRDRAQGTAPTPLHGSVAPSAAHFSLGVADADQPTQWDPSRVVARLRFVKPAPGTTTSVAPNAWLSVSARVR